MRIVNIIVLFVLFLSFNIKAQKTAIHDQPHADYRLARELFVKEKYGAAMKQFQNILNQYSFDENISEIMINSKYYKAVCAFELFHPDAEKLLLDYINNHKIHPKQSVAAFYMGNLQYRNRNYEEALEWYDRVDRFDIYENQRNDFRFKNGHSHFMIGNYDIAKRYFFDIKDQSSVYYNPAQYYYGHIAYEEENYETALRSFNKLVDDNNFGPIVPYYITHIYHKQKKYNELLEIAPQLLEDASPRRKAEIARLIGDAYYSQSNYEKAIEYLEKYISKTRDPITEDDYYQLAYAYYSINDYENAIRNFERIIRGDNKMAQNAYYLLADCYIKTGNKRSAINAFKAAYEMDFIPEITQDALFNYAKLAYQLSYSPFNESIISFQRYIDKYPNSPRINKAYEYLIDLYLTTNNYRDAISSMEKIELNTPNLRKAYQRITYYRGIELFNNTDYETAINYFRRSMQYPENNIINAQCIYWIAEANFRMGNYDKAINKYNKFLITPGAFSLKEYNKAYYDLGYAYFNIERFENAITQFRKFISEGTDNNRLLNDAYLRLADSYFITNNYSNAIDYYDRAINKGIFDVDYAVFQKATAFGATGNYREKERALLQFIREYPQSSYIAEAKYELANTYMNIDNQRQALSYYLSIKNDHPNSRFVKSAILKKGLIYYNDFEDEKALEQLKYVIDNYPGTEQAQEALQTMRNVYVNLDRVDEFIKYKEDIGISDMTAAEQDSLMFSAAENRYMKGNCENAVESFKNYLDNFPDGIFSLDANYYSAECYYRLNDDINALRGYEYVAEKPKNRFMENAVRRAANINYELENYSRALKFYQQLKEVAEHRELLGEARIGIMRCLYNIERFDEAVNAAKLVLESDNIRDGIVQEANLIIGNAYKINNEMDTAKPYFEKAAGVVNNEMAAEAKYNIALINFRKGNYDKCEELIFDYVNKITAYEYWLAKMFLLLADNYIEKDNIFQAKHTLQSIVDNYDGPEIVDIAQRRLDEIESK